MIRSRKRGERPLKPVEGPVWTILRKRGPMRQADAVYSAYLYVTEWFGYENEVAFKSLPERVQTQCKKLMTVIIAAGFQSGLVKHRRPSKVAAAADAHAAARSLVENRVHVDKTINGTYL